MERKRADWVPILALLKKREKQLVNWCPSVDFPTSGVFPRSRQAYRDLVSMFFNPDPARRLRLVPIESKSHIYSILGIVLTWIIKGAITDATPIIINPVVSGGVTQGCTAARAIITVDPSTVSPWYQSMGAVREPSLSIQSAAAALPTALPPAHSTSRTVARAPATSVGLLPMTQGLGVISSDELQLGYDFTMGSRSFAPSDPMNSFAFPSSTSFASGPAARLYENDPQGLPFLSSTTMGPTSIHPSSSGRFGLYHTGADSTVATASAQTAYPSLVGKGGKRSSASPAVRNDPSKRRRTEELSEHVVQRVGYQGRTTAIGPPVPAASFNRPPEMSIQEYVNLLESKIAAGSGTATLD